jgi:hypothetical protein
MLALSEFLELIPLDELQLNGAPGDDCEDEREHNPGATEAKAIFLQRPSHGSTIT